jgi:sugar lactone lactonase YvrE
MKRRIKMKNFFLVVSALSIVLFANTNMFSQPTIEVYATGLLNPIGIEIDDAGNLWVGEQGTGSGQTASVSMVTPDGQVHPFMVNLPSAAPAFEPIGVTDVYFDIDGKLIIVTAQNTSGDTLGARLLKVDTTGYVPGGPPFNRSNIESIINLNTLLSNGNPYKVTAGFENDLFVVDAYYNKVVRWHRSNGSLTVFSTFAPIGQSEAVPTCIAYNDTNFFVGNLVGLPVPIGAANIYTVDLAGNNSVYQGGLTAVVDVAINPIDHSLYALQHAEFGPPWLNNKGRLFRIQNGVVDTLISGMQRPSGMVFNSNGDLFITSIQNDNIIKVSNLPVGVEDENNFVADDFSLEQNYPNPFNPSTSIQYQVPSISNVSLKVYDVLGNEVSTLVNEEKPAGSYEVSFDAAGLSSGIYFYKLQAGSLVETKKMILMK